MTYGTESPYLPPQFRNIQDFELGYMNDEESELHDLQELRERLRDEFVNEDEFWNGDFEMFLIKKLVIYESVIAELKRQIERK